MRVNTFIQQVLPNRDIREYVLTLMSSFKTAQLRVRSFIFGLVVVVMVKVN